MRGRQADEDVEWFRGAVMIGRHLSHFEITDKLGEGGMGEVWLARDTRLGRTVALKTLPLAQAESGDRRHRFEDEARAASALNHPGIAHIYDVGEADGVHFIAMEHVGGESLERRIQRAAFTTSEIVDLGSRLADALAGRLYLYRGFPGYLKQMSLLIQMYHHHLRYSLIKFC